MSNLPLAAFGPPFACFSLGPRSRSCTDCKFCVTSRGRGHSVAYSGIGGKFWVLAAAHGRPTSTNNKMPMMELNDEQKAAGYNSVQSDLRYLLEEREVPRAVIEIMGHVHVRRLNVFAHIESTEDALRTWIKDDLGIEPRGLGKATTAMIIDSWVAARGMAQHVTTREAEAKLDGRPKELLKSTHLDLRKALTSAIGRVKDQHYPSYTYLNWRFEQVEEGEWRAEKLEDVTSYEREQREGQPDFTMDWSKSGGLQMKRSKLKGTMPAEGDTEELRTRYRIMANHWAIVRMRHPGLVALEGLLPETWTEHLDYLLSEDVRGITARNSQGHVIASLSWHAFLHYEYEMRIWAMAEVNAGRFTIAAALEAARADSLLRTKHVITPLSLANVEASASSGGEGRKRTRKGDHKGKQYEQEEARAPKKGKGSGKGKKGAEAGTDDNWNLLRKWKLLHQSEKKYCWGFNRAGCKTANCSFTHECGYCGSTEHGVSSCTAFAKFRKAHKA